MIRELATNLLRAVVGTLRSRAALLAENALLRQQIIILRRAVPRPRLKVRDRLAIAWVSRVFPAVLNAVTVVRPETVVRWHRSLWKLLWRRRSRRPVGRPPVDADTRALIRRMWKENPLWGEDVIAAELAKLGHHVSARTVAKYRPANLPRGRGQKWLTFVRNHLGQTWACDWFTIVSLRFHLLYAFVIIDLERREVVHIGVTPHPSAQYAAQSFVEAVSDRDNQAPRFLIRDRDSIYGVEFRRRVKSGGTRCLLTPPRVPRANAFCERVIGTLRRCCLDIPWCPENDRGDSGTNSRRYGAWRGMPDGAGCLAMLPATLQLLIVELASRTSPKGKSGKVVCRSRLGGTLNFYHREAA